MRIQQGSTLKLIPQEALEHAPHHKVGPIFHLGRVGIASQVRAFPFGKGGAVWVIFSQYSSLWGLMLWLGEEPPTDNRHCTSKHHLSVPSVLPFHQLPNPLSFLSTVLFFSPQLLFFKSKPRLSSPRPKPTQPLCNTEMLPCCFLSFASLCQPP